MHRSYLIVAVPRFDVITNGLLLLQPGCSPETLIITLSDLAVSV